MMCQHYAKGQCDFCEAVEAVQRARLAVMKVARKHNQLDPVENTLTQALAQLETGIRFARVASTDLLAPSESDLSHAVEVL